MDYAAQLASSLGQLPYWKPIMLVNISGTCATTKLIQCQLFGILTCEVTRKFQQDPEAAADLFEGDFLERKRVVQSVASWCRGSKYKYVPILYDYEIVAQSAKRLKDRGHLVFTDGTLTRFLLVMCFGESHPVTARHHQLDISFEDDYEAITKANASRFMSLLKYLHHSERQPLFVRATYTTQGQRLHPDFLSSFRAPVENDVPIYHITPDNFTPSLLASDIEKIDALITQCQLPSLKPAPPEVRKAVIGTKVARPSMTHFMLADTKTVTQCAHCGKGGLENKPTCSRCKLVRYCGKACQKAAWNIHKVVCVAPERQSPVQSPTIQSPDVQDSLNDLD